MARIMGGLRTTLGCAAALGALLAAGAAKAAGPMTDVGTPRDQTLIVDMLDSRITNPTNMNPFQEGAALIQGLHQLALGQLWEIDTKTGKQFPDMAATMPEALDNSFTRYRFKVRSGLTWSDGVPFTAADVVFTARMIMDHPDLAYSSVLRGLVKSISNPDDTTVELQTQRPSPRLSMELGSVLFGNLFRPVPEHIWKNVDPAKFGNYPPVGIGAYKLKSSDPNGYWFLWEKRADWQHSDVGQIAGEPKPRYVLFRSYGTEEKRVLAMAQNQMDILTDISPESLQILQQQNKDVHAWFDHFPYADFNDPCERGIHFNTSKQPYNKWQVRWALALATDLQQANIATFSGMLRASPLAAPPIDIIMKAYDKPMTAWLASFALPDGYKPFDGDYAVKLAAELRKEGVDDVPTTDAAARDLFGVGWWKHDPAEAGKLLQSVGFKKSSSGWTLPDGKPWQMTITAPADFEIESQRLAFAVANQWKQFGVDVHVQQVQQGPFFGNYATGDFEAGSYWSSSCAVSQDLFVALEQWNQKYVRPDGVPSSSNRERFKDANVSRIVDELTALRSDDPKVATVGTDLLKSLVTAMPDIDMFGTSKFVPVDAHYWTNFPSANNFYEGPWWWWSNFKFIMAHFQPSNGKQ
jgi:peptide/nickel transport system substrate-binding protein